MDFKNWCKYLDWNFSKIFVCIFGKSFRTSGYEHKALDLRFCQQKNIKMNFNTEIENMFIKEEVYLNQCMYEFHCI